MQLALISYSRLQIADCRLQIAGRVPMKVLLSLLRLQIADCRIQIAECNVHMVGVDGGGGILAL